ncbi:MAG: 3-hydroxyacyl-CoA dehydrogenase NAD-binding domain-containing protein [Thermoleophilia bacterium]|nr:3-hydroxyacyl-CoA dehydrogenase NAD-binding domain-containing protein [Gaiellaceae bacterium]MDW8337850.1 3-hydroxyacyl-CoA dehydrogenase NAD-binding domain-containing protein [Thermoleophilia bacterium]
MASPTRFALQPVETAIGPVALVTIDNGEDWQKPTTFGEAALRSLNGVLDALERDDWAGMVLTGKPFVFAAGADIDELGGITAERAREGSAAGHALFGRIRSLPFPTLAAINGAALGGGVEIALHCDFRTIASSVRHFACPEVFLGLIPGWGGTQLIPRLVGAALAVRFIVESPLRQNRMLSAQEAFEQGFVDALLDPVEFLDESLAWLVRAIEERRPPRSEADLSDAPEVVRKARARVEGQVHGAAPAPYRALDLIEGAARWSLEEGYRAEEDALAELLPGPQAQASLYAFDLVERRAKRRAGIPDAAPREVRKAGIVGAGLMARQLALLVLRRLEVPVVLRDLEQALVDDAIAWIRSELDELVRKGRLGEGKSRFLASLVSGGTAWEPFAGCDLVLEAVVEELAVKKDVLARVEQVVAPECVLATNTSSLSVTAMGADLEHPERLLGMHFFNPVAVLPLVELVRTETTDDVVLATAAWVTERLRKRGVLVRDAPGFVVNRLLARQGAVVTDALDHGNTVEETDEAVLRLGLPMAPSVLLQLVGPRVANHVRHTLHAAWPDRFPLSPTLESLAKGGGPVVVEYAPRTVDEIHEAVLEALADEAAHILRDGVVPSAADIDTCMLLGAGFPFWLGGITKHLDQIGVSQRVVGRPLAEISARGQ